MKIKFISCGLLAANLAVAGAIGCTSEKQAQLQSQAKISRSQAEQIAIARILNGTIKECDIEKKHGKLLWSFDIATPGSQNITEVAVGGETPEQQASEKD